MRAGLKVFFQYALRFADRLKSQLLISHCYLPIQKTLTGEADKEIKSALRLSHQFLFRGAVLHFVLPSLPGPKCGNAELAFNVKSQPLAFPDVWIDAC